MKPCTTCPADRQRSEETSHDRHAQYSLAATQAAIPPSRSLPAPPGVPSARRKRLLDLPQVSAARADRVELNASQALDPVRMEAAGSWIQQRRASADSLPHRAESALGGLLQRDNENQSIIHAQKAQVDEMRSGATLMIAMAVIAGVGALASAVVGSPAR